LAQVYNWNSSHRPGFVVLLFWLLLSNLSVAMAHERHDVSKEARGIVPFWGVLGVIAFLGNGFRRVLPVALEPFRSGEPVPPAMGLAYVGVGAFMAYVEGYRGFHKRFSPNVVARSLTLSKASANSANVGWKTRVFAPFYCMELFGAPPGRIISAWSFLSSIFVIVAVVKKLPPRVRSVVDAGVCTGMGLGMLSLAYHFLNAAAFGLEPPPPEAKDSVSYCPVTAMSNTIGGAVKFCVSLCLGKDAADRLEQAAASKGFLKCPISGKNGASEAECPMAKFMGGLAPPNKTL